MTGEVVHVAATVVHLWLLTGSCNYGSCWSTVDVIITSKPLRGTHTHMVTMVEDSMLPSGCGPRHNLVNVAQLKRVLCVELCLDSAAARLVHTAARLGATTDAKRCWAKQLKVMSLGVR